MNGRVRRGTVALVGGALVLTAAGGALAARGVTAAAPEPTTMRFVLASAATGAKEEVATYAVALQYGFLAEENIEVEITLADGSTAAFQGLAGGSSDVTAGSALTLAPAVAQGVPIKAFGGLVQNFPYLIAVSPDSDIETIADLAGSKIGIISLASASNSYARAALTLAELDPDNDVELLPVGAGPGAAAAIDDGQVDALALYGGAYAALEANGLELRYLENDPFFDQLFSITWTAPASALAERPDDYARFARAMYKGLLFSAANPEAAMRAGYEVFPELLPPSGDPEERLAEDTATLEAWIASAVPVDGEPADWGDWGDISEERWDALIGFLIDSDSLSAPVPVDDLWDGSLIAEINDFDREAVLDLAAGA